MYNSVIKMNFPQKLTMDWAKFCLYICKIHTYVSDLHPKLQYYRDRLMRLRFSVTDLTAPPQIKTVVE